MPAANGAGAVGRRAALPSASGRGSAPRPPRQSGPPERKSHAGPRRRTRSQRRPPPGRAGWLERLNQKRPETEFGTRGALTVTQMRIILDASVSTVKRLRVSLGTLVAIE